MMRPHQKRSGEGRAGVIHKAKKTNAKADESSSNGVGVRWKAPSTPAGRAAAATRRELPANDDGGDWVCLKCDGTNHPARKRCSSCMGWRGGSKKKVTAATMSAERHAGDRNDDDNDNDGDNDKDNDDDDDDDDGGDPPFRRSGHPFIGRRVRYFLPHDAEVCIDGAVTGYLSPRDVDSGGRPAYLCSRTSRPAALFHVDFNEANLHLMSVDLEEWELEEKCSWLPGVVDEDEENDDDDDDDDCAEGRVILSMHDERYKRVMWCHFAKLGAKRNGAEEARVGRVVFDILKGGRRGRRGGKFYRRRGRGGRDGGFEELGDDAALASEFLCGPYIVCFFLHSSTLFREMLRTRFEVFFRPLMYDISSDLKSSDRSFYYQ